ncbi:unnamed protein product, partial [Dibothriocephalus latus]
MNRIVKSQGVLKQLFTTSSPSSAINTPELLIEVYSRSSAFVSHENILRRPKIGSFQNHASMTMATEAYQNYCSNQSLSATFPDFFGYAEDEFDDCRERLDVVVEQALSGLN